MTVTYERIATASSSGSSVITFSSIPSTYTDLRFIFVCGVGGAITSMRYNGDTGSNYHSVLAWAQGTTATTARYSIGYTFAIPPGGSQQIQQRIDINSYSNSTTYKTSMSRVDVFSTSTTFGIQLWKSTSAINSVSLVNSGTFDSYVITLYGIKKE
jgi:hypothetical protein